MAFNGASLTNSGTINAAAGAEVAIDGTSFTNAGVITAAVGGTVTVDARTLSGLGTVNVAGGTLVLDSSVSLAALGDVSISNSGTNAGVLDINGGTLSLGGGTLPSLGTGTVVLSGGTIAGGAIDTVTANISLAGGSALSNTIVDLAGDTWVGNLDIGNGSANYLQLHVQNGLTVENAGGDLPGTINITGIYDGVDITDNETLSNVGVNLAGGVASYDAFLNAGGILVLGSGATVSGLYGRNHLSGQTMVNDGTITAQGGILYVDASSFTNTSIINGASGASVVFDGISLTNYGTIIAAAGANLALDGTSFSNAGLITAAAGSTITIGAQTVSSLGTVNVAGGMLVLDSAVPLAALGHVSISNSGTNAGVLDINNGGTLSLSGGTLPSLGASTVVLSGGTIAGGTINAVTTNISLPSNGPVFDRVDYLADDTWIGDLDVGDSSTNYLQLDVQGGLTVENTSGGLGTINVTGNYKIFDVTDNETLDNVGINLGFANPAGNNYLYHDYLVAGSTLVLGSNVTVNSVYGLNTLSGDAMVNDGTINAQGVQRANLYIDTGSFTNAGTIDSDSTVFFNGTSFANAGVIVADFNSNLVVDASTFTDTGLIIGNGSGTATVQITPGIDNGFAAGTLTSGAFEATTGDTLALQLMSTDSVITSDAGTLILNGAGSEITELAVPGHYSPLEATLETISTGGTLAVLDGRGYTTSNALTIAGGTFDLDGGTLTASSLTLSVATSRLAGSGVVEDNLVNSGAIEADPGTLDITGAIGGTGVLIIDQSSELELGAGTAENVTFTGAVSTASTLKLDAPSSYTGTLSGLAAGDVIDIASTTVSAVSVSGDNLAISLGGGAIVDLTLASALPTDEQFSISSDGGTGSDLMLVSGTVPCFLLGTKIATPTGEVLVETLRPGDEVSTASGPARVRWVGRRAYHGRFLAGNHLALPVTIHAGALAEGIPVRDLSVSPGHGIWLEGALVPAWRLVNGVSVIQGETVETVEYFNIELEDHVLLFAQGALVESFLDDGVFRNQFQNAAEYWQLYPDAPLCRDVTPLPRRESGFALADIIARVKRRAGIVPAGTEPGPLRGYVDILGADGWIYGWAQDEANPEEPVILRLYTQGRYIARTLANLYRPDVRAADRGSGCHGFACRVPPGCAGTIEVRREADHAPLPLTDALREAAA